MNFIEIWDAFKVFFDAGFSGNSIFFLYVLSLVYITVTEKDARWTLAVPSALLTIFVVNPFSCLYFWAKLMPLSVFRFFWVIPIIPVIAYAVLSIIRSMYDSKKLIVTIILVLLCINSGEFVYTSGSTTFSLADNPYKVNASTLAVANELMNLDNDGTPRIVTEEPLAAQIRQVAPEIQMPFGRWGSGQGSTGPETTNYFISAFGYSEITTSNEDFDWVKAHDLMAQEQFEYLVLKSGQDVIDDGGEEILLSSGFFFVGYAGGYGIYSVS